MWFLNFSAAARKVGLVGIHLGGESARALTALTRLLLLSSSLLFQLFFHHNKLLCLLFFFVEAVFCTFSFNVCATLALFFSKHRVWEKERFCLLWINQASGWKRSFYVRFADFAEHVTSWKNCTLNTCEYFLNPEWSEKLNLKIQTCSILLTRVLRWAS